MPLRRPTRLTGAAISAALIGAVAASGLASAPLVGLGGTSSSSSSVADVSRAELVSSSGRTPADRRIAARLTTRVTRSRFGTRFSGAAMDAGSGAVLWSRHGSTSLMPASNAKLVTAANALTAFGPGYRLRTTTRLGAGPSQVVLVGSGDPTLSSLQVDGLARVTASRLKAGRITSVRVYADDSLFPRPTLAHGWKRSYVPGDITSVRALVRDQRDLPDTSADAATYLGSRLRAYGVRASYAGRMKAPGTSRVLATSVGRRLDAIVRRMLLTSDNEIAEAVHKLVGIRLGKGATWAVAARAQRTQMARIGLPMTALYDGSGLSRADRLSAGQLIRIVDAAFAPRTRTALALLRSRQGLPTAGRTGTLRAVYGRFTARTSRCAAGRVWAKTGTLNDVAALTGWTVGRDGRVKVFSFVVNGRPVTSTLLRDLDMLAATVNGCY